MLSPYSSYSKIGHNIDFNMACFPLIPVLWCVLYFYTLQREINTHGVEFISNKDVSWLFKEMFSNKLFSIGWFLQIIFIVLVGYICSVIGVHPFGIHSSRGG